MSANPADDISGRLHPSIDSRSHLEQAFLSQRPLYVNLLDDLGSGDFFIIDGDALLLDSLASLCRDASHGVQMLQLCYLVERFLDSLQKCLNSRFCFVFFQQHKEFWQQIPSYSLARCVLQNHLQCALGQTVHTDFACWHSLDWLQYVKQVCKQMLLTLSCCILP